MNGDLGNLLTGEMGEAESRFASDDFAEAYGRRVVGRVRRRRTVRAVGVGGGTMLTAGALVVGATHMPWGVLGAAPGMGGSDCVTPSPSIVVGGPPAATDDCYTPSPTPSGVPSLTTDIYPVPDPSLAAKTEDVTSPFQCGFEFPTESRKTDEVSIGAPSWLDPATASVRIPAVPSGSAPLPPDGDLGPVVEVTVAMPGSDRGVIGGYTMLWTSTDPADPALLPYQAGSFDNDQITRFFKSVGFVGVQDGTVVAVPFASAAVVDGGWKTTEAAVSVAASGAWDAVFAHLFLVDRNTLLTPCPGVTTPVADMDITAVAGLVVLQPGQSIGDPSYAWQPLGTP